MKKLLIPLLLIVATSCVQKAIPPHLKQHEEKKMILSTTELTNPYLGNNYKYVDKEEMLKDEVTKLNKIPRIFYFRTVGDLAQNVIDLRHNYNVKILGASAVGIGKGEAEPTKRDLEEAGIIKGANILHFIRIDKHNVLVANKTKGRDMEKEVRIYANGRVEHLVYFLKK